jgi:hypothetical protein
MFTRIGAAENSLDFKQVEGVVGCSSSSGVTRQEEGSVYGQTAWLVLLLHVPGAECCSVSKKERKKKSLTTALLCFFSFSESCPISWT